MKKLIINFYIIILTFGLTNLQKVFAQSLAPIPGVGPTVCVSNCGGNENPTVSDSNGGIGEFCRVESDCDSGLRCVPTFACAAGCIGCTGSTVTTCQISTSTCGFKNRRCSIVQGRFCCRGLTCINEVMGAMIVSRCKRTCF